MSDDSRHPASDAPAPPRETETAGHWPWRQILDRLDAELIASTALADPDVFDARRALGRAIGCLLESEKEGRRVTISARTYPPMDENGAMSAPPRRPA